MRLLFKLRAQYIEIIVARKKVGYMIEVMMVATKKIEKRGGAGREVGRRGRIWELTWLECFVVVVAIHPRMAIISALACVGSHGSYWGLLKRCVPNIALYFMPHVHKD
jgi:hypothetical protein